LILVGRLIKGTHAIKESVFNKELKIPISGICWRKVSLAFAGSWISPFPFG